MACVSKIGSLYELVTKNVVVTTANTIFGINPRIWLSLPCEGLLLLKIRQVVPTTGETLPVQIAIPANSTVSTVGDDPDYKRYIDTHGYHFSKELAREAADKMLNADGSKRRWTMEDAKQMFDKCGAKKPDNATWGDVQYLFAMFYSDYFPKVLDCDQKIVKAVLAYLEDPDAPEGTAFVRYLAVRCFVGDTIKWSDMI
jgi:hypothetical protein